MLIKGYSLQKLLGVFVCVDLVVNYWPYQEDDTEEHQREEDCADFIMHINELSFVGHIDTGHSEAGVKLW